MRFAFIRNSWNRTNNPLMKIQMSYHWTIFATYIVRHSWCSITFWVTICIAQHTFRLPTNQWFFTNKRRQFYSSTFSVWTAYQPLFARLGPIYYPFQYRLTSWYDRKNSITRFFSLTQVPVLLRLVNQCSFPITCFTLTTTAFFSDRCVATVGRLAWIRTIADPGVT